MGKSVWKFREDNSTAPPTAKSAGRFLDLLTGRGYDRYEVIKQRCWKQEGSGAVLQNILKRGDRPFSFQLPTLGKFREQLKIQNLVTFYPNRKNEPLKKTTKYSTYSTSEMRGKLFQLSQELVTRTVLPRKPNKFQKF